METLTVEVFGAGSFGGGNTGLRAMLPWANGALCVPDVTRVTFQGGGIQTPANAIVGLPPGDNRSTRSKGRYRLTGTREGPGACSFRVTKAVRVSGGAAGGPFVPTAPTPPVSKPASGSRRVEPTLRKEKSVMAMVAPGGRIVSSEVALGGLFGDIWNIGKKAAGGVIKGIIPGNFEDNLVDRITGIAPQQRPGPALPRLPFQDRGCGRGTVMDSRGRCVEARMDPRLPAGGGNGAGPYEAVMGRYGAAIEPDVDMRRVFVCPPGSVLGRDDLCYDHLPKRDRKWRPGTKPLLTGGDMRTLRRARSLENRLKRHGLVPPKKKKSRRTKLAG